MEIEIREDLKLGIGGREKNRERPMSQGPGGLMT